MRYQPDYKAASRQKILDTAARLFRRHGYDGVGIDKIMGEAGMTRGGFYGHFRSKAALFEAVLAREADFVVRMKRRPGNTKHALATQAMAVVRGYLAPENRDRIAGGCTMASLSVDVARASKGSRAAFGEMYRELAAEFARGLPRAKPDDPRALVSVALCVGGVILARAVGDPSLANAIAEACEQAVERELQS